MMGRCWYGVKERCADTSRFCIKNGQERSFLKRKIFLDLSLQAMIKCSFFADLEYV